MSDRVLARNLYGEKVDAIPDGAVIIEWEYPDGSGSWVWCADESELNAAISTCLRDGCNYWTTYL
jgi:hypothetical protein